MPPLSAAGHAVRPAGLLSTAALPKGAGRPALPYIREHEKLPEDRLAEGIPSPSANPAVRFPCAMNR